MTNHFQVFDLSPAFKIDLQLLEARYEQLMRFCHPDKFSASPSFEQRAAAKRAVDINEAHTILTHPVRRAGHLLELLGVDLVALERQPASPDFLFEQMMLREQLQAFSELSEEEANALKRKVAEVFSATESRFTSHYEAGDVAAASATWVEFHFQQKLTDELSRAQSQQR